MAVMTMVAVARSTGVLSKSPFFRNGIGSFPPFSARFSYSAPTAASTLNYASKIRRPKWRVAVASLGERGGSQIARDDVVRDEPTNNIPDTIFTKLAMQLHKRNQHPLGILENAIYDYFDTNYANKFDRFDDLSPLFLSKRSYNDTYYIDPWMVSRCHTSAHQAELLSKGHTHFLVTGDVYCRDSIDSTGYPVFHQMEGVCVFSPKDWESSGKDGTTYAAEDLNKCLDGLVRHLFGAVEMHWINTYFPFTSPFELEIYFKYPPCYKDMSFWISEGFTENNLCEVIRGVAGDLVEEVTLIDNFTNKKGMTSHCYQIAYRSMECSLTDEEINDLQWNVRQQVQREVGCCTKMRLSVLYSSLLVQYNRSKP